MTPRLCENVAIPVLTPSSTASGWTCEQTRESPGLITRMEGSGDTASEVRWALLADPHISAEPSKEYLGARPEQQICEALGQVIASPPQAMLIAGDLAWEEGLPGDYRRLRSILEPAQAQFPICLMPGNHDNRAALLAEFGPPEAGAAGPIERSVIVCEHGPIRWILLDSLYRSDVVPGLLGEAQRRWLRDFLECAAERPTLLCVHHPLGEQDDRLLDSDRLLQIVEPSQMVKAVFTAHDHAYRIESERGIAIVGLPAVGMPFRESDATGWLEASLCAEGATLTFHAVGGNKTGDGEQTVIPWR